MPSLPLRFTTPCYRCHTIYAAVVNHTGYATDVAAADTGYSRRHTLRRYVYDTLG